jgi:hypothetical protein
VLASYTYGKSLDFSSSIQEQVYPYNYRMEYAPSAFDIKQNFVVSYNYELPIAKLSGRGNRWTDGWALSVSLVLLQGCRSRSQASATMHWSMFRTTA